MIKKVRIGICIEDDKAKLRVFSEHLTQSAFVPAIKIPQTLR